MPVSFKKKKKKKKSFPTDKSDIGLYRITGTKAKFKSAEFRNLLPLQRKVHA